MDKQHKIMFIGTNKQISTQVIHWISQMDILVVLAISAESLEISLQYYNEYIFDLIVLNVDVLTVPIKQALESLQKINPQVAILVLSTKPDYSVMRECLRCHVMDVVYTPQLTRDDIHNYVNQIVKQLVVSHETKYEEMDELENIFSLIRDNLPYNIERFHQLVDQYCFDSHRGSCRLIYFRADSVIWNYLTKIKNRDEFKNEIKSLLMENALDDSKIVFGKKHSGLIVLFKSSAEEVLQFNEKLQVKFRDTLGVTFSFSYTKVAIQHSEFKNTYVKLMDALATKFYQGDETIVSVEEFSPLCRLGRSDLHYKNDIGYRFSKKNYDSAEFFRTKIIAYFKENRIAGTDCIAYFRETIKRIIEVAMADNEEADKIEKQFLTFLRYSETIDRLDKDTKKLFQALAYMIQKKHDQSQYLWVNEVKTYVADHLHQPIGLEQIAEELQLSKHYISRMFKVRTNVALFDYINLEKIKQAKIMLRNSDAPVADIATALGFSNQLYFSKVFRKYTNTNPLAYRKGTIEAA